MLRPRRRRSGFVFVPVLSSSFSAVASPSKPTGIIFPLHVVTIVAAPMLPRRVAVAPALPGFIAAACFIRPKFHGSGGDSLAPAEISLLRRDPLASTQIHWLPCGAIIPQICRCCKSPNPQIRRPSANLANGDHKNLSLNSSALRLSSPAKIGFSACATKDESGPVLTGVLFNPFEEVKKELSLVPSVPQDSLARQKFVNECESAINDQINVEYNVSYVYHALYAYFDRDNVALEGLAKFFKESSIEEREHAEKLMEYQNKRGGKVKLGSILMPRSEFDNAEKGDALHAMELALSLEKVTNDKLLHLHKVAEENNDVQLQEFIEGEYLNEQVESIKKISEYVAQLRRVGKGLGVWHFDQALLHEGGAA